MPRGVSRRAQPTCIVMIFRPLPMDPILGLLTIERLEHPAMGVSKKGQGSGLGWGCQGSVFDGIWLAGLAHRFVWAGRPLGQTVQWAAVHGANVSSLTCRREEGTAIIAKPQTDDLQRGLDDMSRVCSMSTRHPDTTPSCDRVAACGTHLYSTAYRNANAHQVLWLSTSRRASGGVGHDDMARQAQLATEDLND
jgi:hypothetical protein